MSLTDVLLAKSIVGGGSGTGEDTTNKVSSITDENKSSTTYYPSVKAVVDYNPIVTIPAEISNAGGYWVVSPSVDDGGFSRMLKFSELFSFIEQGKIVCFKGQNPSDSNDVVFCFVTSAKKWMDSAVAYASCSVVFTRYDGTTLTNEPLQCSGGLNDGILLQADS